MKSVVLIGLSCVLIAGTIHAQQVPGGIDGHDGFLQMNCWKHLAAKPKSASARRGGVNPDAGLNQLIQRSVVIHPTPSASRPTLPLRGGGAHTAAMRSAFTDAGGAVM